MKKFILGAGAGMILSGLVFGGLMYFGPPSMISGLFESPAPDINAERFSRVKAVKQVRPFVGQWASDEGALPGMDRKWIVLWVSSDGLFQAELLSRGGPTGVITQSWKGKLAVLENGRVSGSFESDLPEVSPIRKFVLSKPDGGNMSLIGDGVSINLEFKGL